MSTIMNIVGGIKMKKQVHKAPPGEYTSISTSVTDPPGYAPGHAILIKYSLTAANGAKYHHQEIFHIVHPTNRTYEFDDYLDDLGCEEYSDFVGFKERLVLEKQVTSKGVFTNITSRKPLYVEGDGDVSDSASSSDA